MRFKRALAGLSFVVGIAAVPAAFAHVGVAVQIGVPPPAPVVVYVPAPRYGYVWVRGRWIAQRPGYWVRHKHHYGHARYYDRYAYYR